MKILKTVWFQLLLAISIFSLTTTTLWGRKSVLSLKNQGETEIKVQKLLLQLTLDEKILLLAGTGFDTVPIERLGIPALKMTDGPAGIRAAPASSFPSGAALAASFDPKIVYAVGQAIAQEAKAKGKNVLLAPCINIERVPLWGRNFECFGEDPFLSGQMAIAYIKGVQSENVISSVKHFAANNQEQDRMTIDVRANERTLNEIYFPAFKAAVEQGGVWSVMASYNKLNGFHAAENNLLLTQVLKKRWGFQGFVVSDWGAVHSTVPTVQNGLDLEMPTGAFLNSSEIKKALQSKVISEVQINDMVRRLLRIIITAGLMNGKPVDK
ncbi:MAG: glycoside hydrolase family 3 N-terminal domain-containing protein, partial [Pyrinomonadaceae bacterium]